MSGAKALRLRKPAERDLLTAVDYYSDHAPHVVDAFVDAFEEARAHVERHPGTGSLRYAEAMNMPGLRGWLLTGFPCVMFYVERTNHLEGIRLLHQHSDIPAWLHDDRKR